VEQDSVRDTRGGDFAWFHRAFLELGLGWKANLVYMGLVTFANGKTQECFPSKATLAKLLGVSTPTIFRGLKTLERSGAIRIDSRDTTGRGQISNEYVLLPTPMSVGHGGLCPTDTPPMSVGHPNKKKINKKNFNQKKETLGIEDYGVGFSKTYPKRDGDEDDYARARVFRMEAKRVAKRFNGDTAAAESWLLGRATVYAASMYVETSLPQFIPLARNWLLHKEYDASEESWDRVALRSKLAGFQAEREQLKRII